MRLESVAVLDWWQHPSLKKSEPVYVIARDEASQIVDAGHAEWCDKFRAVQLRVKKKPEEKFSIRGASCSPRPWVMDAYVRGEKWAIEMIDARKFISKGIGASPEWLDGAPKWM